MPKFPVHLLQPRGGEISALIFSNPENPFGAVPEGLYWSITIKFAPLVYQNQNIEPSMSCDWLTIPIRDWKELAGMCFEGDEEQIEASFYVWEHDWGIYSRIAIGERAGFDFQVRYDMTVEFSGWSEDDADPALPVSANVVIPYTGIAIHPSLVEPLPENAEQAAELAARFVDLATHEAPHLAGCFRLRPRL